MRIINFIKNHFLLKIQLQGERKKKKKESQSRRRKLDPASLWCHAVAIEHTDIIEIHYCSEPIRAGSQSTARIINNAKWERCSLPSSPSSRVGTEHTARSSERSPAEDINYGFPPFFFFILCEEQRDVLQLGILVSSSLFSGSKWNIQLCIYTGH